METMTTTHGCDLAADAPKAYVLLPTGLLRSTGGVRLRAADVTVLGCTTGIPTDLRTVSPIAFAPTGTTAPPGPPLTT